MKKISFSQIFTPEEYDAPLLSSRVKEQILKKTIGQKSVFKRLRMYQGMGVLTLMFVVVLFMYGTLITNKETLSPSMPEDQLIKKDYQESSYNTNDSLWGAISDEMSEQSFFLQEKQVWLQNNVSVTDSDFSIVPELDVISAWMKQETISWWGRLRREVIELRRKLFPG